MWLVMHQIFLEAVSKFLTLEGEKVPYFLNISYLEVHVPLNIPLSSDKISHDLKKKNIEIKQKI